MILCLDIGNTHVFGGVLEDKKIKLRFRYPSKNPCTSDTIGLFLKEVLIENGINAKEIKAIVVSSVVPALEYSIHSACKKYFSCPVLELKPGVKTGLKLDIKNPLELGSDRIANAVAAMDQFPNKNLIIIDFGTATTVCAISKNKVYLGGCIFAGLKTSMEALSQNAAKLFAVEIEKPESALGKSTESQIQIGLYYGQLGTIKEIIQQYEKSIFKDETPVIVTTGGYSQLFSAKDLKSANIPDLILQGLRLIHEKNSA